MHMPVSSKLICCSWKVCDLRLSSFLSNLYLRKLDFSDVLHQSNVKCFTPLLTIVPLYHGVSWISYQYYLSIYHDTGKSVVMLSQQPWALRTAAITTICKAFGMTRLGIEPTTSYILGGRSTITPSRRFRQSNNRLYISIQLTSPL